VLEAHGGELARLGGDEFAVVVQRARDGATVEAIATGVITALREPFAVGSLRLGIDASIGAGVFPTHGQDASALMRCADIAMYEAKRKHLSIALYSAADDRHSPRRLTLAHALGEAIHSGQIVVHYQPILELKERRVRGVEALARWLHPQHGLVAPGEFIAVAETGDQIRQLTSSVLAQAVAQWDTWRKGGFLTSMAVNLSTRVLVDRGFAEETRRILARHDMPGERLQFEITESAMLSDAERAIATVQDLNALGVTFSIDDFGIGFSSLSYLKRLPIHSLRSTSRSCSAWRRPTAMYRLSARSSTWRTISVCAWWRRVWRRRRRSRWSRRWAATTRRAICWRGRSPRRCCWSG
jgi:predicted signal transduction protein with EAL and GGDEF domain